MRKREKQRDEGSRKQRILSDGTSMDLVQVDMSKRTYDK